MPRPPAIFGPGPLGGRGSPLEDEAQSQLDLYGQLGINGVAVRRRPASGQAFRTKTTRQEDRTVERKTPLTHVPEQMLPFYEQLQGMPEYQDYWGGLQAAGIDADMAGGPQPGPDLSPIMGFADYVAPGGTALRSYTKPERGADRLKRTLDAQQKLQDDRRDLLKTIVSAMALARSGGFQSDTTKTRTVQENTTQSPNFGAGGNPASRFDPLKYKKGFEDSKTVEPFQQRLTNGERLLSEIQGDPNWFKSRNAQALIVEFRGLKPVSDKDYEAGAGGKNLINQFNALVQKYLDNKGDFTPEDIAVIRSHVSGLMHDANLHMEKLSEQFAEAVIKTDPRAAGVSLEQAKQILRPYKTGFISPQGAELSKTQMQRIMEAVEKAEKKPSGKASPTPPLGEQVEKAKKGLSLPEIKAILQDLKKPKRTDQ